MSIIVCPGIHDPDLTENFILGVGNGFSLSSGTEILVYPGNGVLALSSFGIVQFLGDRLRNKLRLPVIFISFSAGVVGAIGAAHIWQMLGGKVKAFIAIDGWGMPLWGNFPIHRMSHDYFTHCTTLVLGDSNDDFYAYPSVKHLDMWQCLQRIQGWRIDSSVNTSCPAVETTATEFLHLLLNRYAQN